MDEKLNINDQFKYLTDILSINIRYYSRGENRAYLLSKKWCNECKNIISSLKKSDFISDKETNLPPIDNNDLIDKEKHYFKNDNLPDYFFLNRDKLIDIDFLIIKEEEWLRLHSIFNGGPAITVPITYFNSYETTLHPVSDFIDIFVTYRENSNELFVTYREIEGSILEEQLRLFFNVPQGETTQLKHVSSNGIVNQNKTLSQQLITNNFIFELEFQDFQGNWVSCIKDVPNEEENPPASSSNSSLHRDENETEKPLTATPVPSPTEQYRIFRELDRTNDTFTEGENNAYLVSLKWFETFRELSELQSESSIPLDTPFVSDSSYLKEESLTNEAEGEESVRVPPIDNSDLMKIDGDELVPDRSKKEQIDFKIVHPNVWKQLIEWFGGGPEIPIPVYFSQITKKPSPVTEFLDIPIEYKDQVTNQFEIGKNVPLSLIHARARLFYNVPDDESTRLVSVKDSHCLHLKDDNRQSLYTYCEFRPETRLVLDYIDRDSSDWHTKTESQIRTSSSMRPFSHESNLPSSSHSLDKILEENEKESDDSDDHNIFNRHYSQNYYNRDVADPGVCGLMNLGNTCFFNSGIQCLVHTRLLVKHFLYENWESELNTSNPIGMHGDVAVAFAELTKQIWSGKYNTVSPDRMKEVIGRFAPQFSGYGQQDSHELITFMLDGIHEDLNRVTKKPIVESIDGDGNNDEEVADEAWRRYKIRNDSVIVNLFHSQLRSRLVCPKCKKITVVFDPYMSIQLPIQKPNKQVLNIIFVPSKFSPSCDDGNSSSFPFDVNCQHIKISIKTNKKPTTSEISELVSKKIGRKVDVVLCHSESYLFSIHFNLGISTSANNTNYALEIPESKSGNASDKRIFAICAIVCKAKKMFSYISSSSDDYKAVTNPFLIPIPSFQINSDEFVKICGDFFDGFWSGDETPLTDSQKRFMENLKIELLRSSEPNPEIPRFLVEKEFGSLRASLSDPRIAFPIQVVSVNQATMGKEYHFSFSLFLKNTRNTKYRSAFISSSNPSENQIDLKKCFKYFSQNETLDENNKWFCPHCRDFVCADKKMDIWSAPEILVIQLKRFLRSGEYFMQKLDTNVQYPSEFDISPFLAGPQRNEKMIYRLYAVSEHSGSLSGGHYTAHARVPNKNMSEEGGKWYSFNDSFVSKSNSKSAHNSGAYVLFYERVNDESDHSTDQND